MPKKIIAIIKLALPSGKATPAPPIGPALGQYGLNIMNFCKEYNARTNNTSDTITPVEISAFDDRSFSFILKTPPASVLLTKITKVAKGSGEPNKDFVGCLSYEQLTEIAKIKLPDLNTNDVKSAVKIIEGTARNMGVKTTQ